MSWILEIGVKLWDFFGTIGSRFYNLGDKLDDIPLVGGALEDIADWIGDRFLDVATWVYNAALWGDDVWYDLLDVWGDLGNIWDWIWQRGEVLWGWLANIDNWFAFTIWPYLQGILGDVADWFIGAYDWLITGASNIIDWFAGIDAWFASRWQDMWGTVSDSVSAVIDFFNEFGEKIVGFFNNPGAYIAAFLGEALELFLEVAGWPFLHAIELFLDRIWEEEE